MSVCASPFRCTFSFNFAGRWIKNTRKWSWPTENVTFLVREINKVNECVSGPFSIYVFFEFCGPVNEKYPKIELANRKRYLFSARYKQGEWVCVRALFWCTFSFNFAGRWIKKYAKIELVHRKRYLCSARDKQGEWVCEWAILDVRFLLILRAGE